MRMGTYAIRKVDMVEGAYGRSLLICFLTLSRKQGYGLRVRMEKDVSLGDKDSEWQGKNGLLDNPF